MVTNALPRHPFRFAAGLGEGVDLAGLVAYARRVESWGYDALLIPDHLFERLAPLPALGAVAEATSRLRVGTFVLNNNLRHHAVLAQELATLDRLSGGRLEIGLGVGWNAEEHRQAGLPFGDHRARVDRLTEAIGVLKGLFGPGPFSFRGRHYQITGLEGRPEPVQ